MNIRAILERNDISLIMRRTLEAVASDNEEMLLDADEEIRAIQISQAELRRLRHRATVAGSLLHIVMTADGSLNSDPAWSDKCDRLLLMALGMLT